MDLKEQLLMAKQLIQVHTDINVIDSQVNEHQSEVITQVLTMNPITGIDYAFKAKYCKRNYIRGYMTDQ